MNHFAKLLKSPEPSSAELRDALDHVDIAGKLHTVENIAAARHQALIDGETGTSIVALDGQLAEARLEVERAQAIHAELTKRLVAATERERLDQLQARITALNSEATTLAKYFSGRYQPAMQEISDHVRRHDAYVTSKLELNRQLEAAGTTDRVAEIVIPIGVNDTFVQSVRRLNGFNGANL